MADRRLRLIIEAQNKAQTAFASVEGNLQKLNSKIVANNKSFEDSFGALSSKLQSVGQTMTIGVTLPIIALGTAVFKTYAEMDSLNRGMVAVTGSSARAAVEFIKLREVAKLPGLGFKEALQGSINLQAAGASADQARKYLQAFGNAIATVGGGKADLDGVNLALTQLMNRTSGFGQEIRQLQERLPQIRQIMIKAFGTADSELIGKMGVTGKQFVDIIAAEFARLPKMTGGPKNAIENLQDAWITAMDKIGKSMAPVMTKAIDQLTNFATALSKANPKVLDFGIKVAGAAAIVGPVLIGLNQLVIALGSVRSAYIFAATAAKGFTVASAATAGALALIVGGAAWLAINAPDSTTNPQKVAAAKQTAINRMHGGKPAAESLESQRIKEQMKLLDMPEGAERNKADAAINAKYAKLERDAKAKNKKFVIPKLPVKMPKTPKVRAGSGSSGIGDAAEDAPTLMELADAKAQSSLQWLEDSYTLGEISLKDKLAGFTRILDKQNAAYNNMSKNVRASVFTQQKSILDSIQAGKDAVIQMNTEIAKKEDEAQKEISRKKFQSIYNAKFADYETRAIGMEQKGNQRGADKLRIESAYMAETFALGSKAHEGYNVDAEVKLAATKRDAAIKGVNNNFAKSIWDRIQLMRQEADEYVLNIQRQIEADRERERSRIRWTSSEELWRNANIQGASARLNTPLPFLQMSNRGQDPTQDEVAKATSDTAEETKKMNNKLDTMISLLGLQPEGAAT